MVHDDQVNVDDLVAKLMMAKHTYYNTTDCDDWQNRLTDAEFDSMEAQLRYINPTHEYFSVIGATVVSNKKHKHNIPMGSLNKLQIDDNGIEKLISKFGVLGQLICSYKMDGISVSVDYINGEFVSATTRGDGVYGELISDATIIKGINSKLPNNFTGTLRGEIIMSWDNFEKLNETLDDSDNFEIDDSDKYSNPRNATAGISRRDDNTNKEYLEVYYYNCICDDIKFNTKLEVFNYLSQLIGNDRVAIHMLYSSHDDMSVDINAMNMNRTNLPYMIDGLVFELNDLELYTSMGSVDGTPKGAVALKFTAVSETSEMVDVLWQIGSIGSITPVAVFKPTLIDGSIVSRASLHNYDMFNAFNFGIGDKISVHKSNDIIPEITGVIEQSNLPRFIPPKTCHICGEILVIRSPFLMCENPTCPAKHVGNVSKLVDKFKMNTKGVGEAFISSYCEKYKDVFTIFDLSVEDILQLSDRYKLKSAQNIYDAIQSSKSINAEDFFGALNIPSCGSRTFKKILSAYTHEEDSSEYIDGVVNFILNTDLDIIDGIGVITSEQMKNGIMLSLEIISELKSKVSITIPTSNTSNKGSFLFTGAFNRLNPSSGTNYKRSELERLVKKYGGTIGSTVNKDLTYLVTTDADSTSSKMVKAKKLGITILNGDDFLSLING